MATKSKQFFSEIEQVRRPLEAWRRTRKHGETIPEGLWTAMASLAKTYGVNPVSQALRVEYYGLKRRMTKDNSGHPSAPSRPAFVELTALPACRKAGCTVELEDRSGAKMTLRLDPGNGLDALVLAQAFWRRRA